MKKVKSHSLRWLMGWFGMYFGAWLGWYLADIGWGILNPRGVWSYGPPPIPVSYWLMKISWSMCGGVLGLAIARWPDVPTGENDDLLDAASNETASTGNAN